MFNIPSAALERASLPIEDEDRPWAASTGCYITYYNLCTGWVWTWSGWGPNDVVGTVFENCCADQGHFGQLDVMWLFVRTGSPSGYGFTGTISARHTDANWCPTSTMSSQPFLPVNGWNGFLLGPAYIGAQPIAVCITLGPGASPPNPVAFDTDRPAAGPTGPPACEFCYPSTRITHSFYYGTTSAPLCPGSPFFDGVCNAELRWEGGVAFEHPCGPIAIARSSWGSIKSMYR